MGNINRKTTKSEMARIANFIKEAYPDFNPVFGGHGNYGAPRDHAISFRLQGNDGKFHSNVIWLMPDWLVHYTIEDIKDMVKKSGGRKK